MIFTIKNQMFSNTYNEFNFEARNCFNQNNNNFEFLELEFDFNNEVRDRQASFTDIKSTEELSQRNYSSMSLVAEENEHVNKEILKPAKNLTVSCAPDLDKLAQELRALINTTQIEDVVAEALDYQFCMETDETRPIQQKKKKSDSQIQELEEALAHDKNWSKEFIKGLATKLNLKFRQVYKWYWDRTQKKAKKEASRRSSVNKTDKFEDIEAAFAF